MAIIAQKRSETEIETNWQQQAPITNNPITDQEVFDPQTKPTEQNPNKTPGSANIAVISLPANTFNDSFKSDGIDDSLVVDFSFEKFSKLQFSIKKNISLFFQDTFPYFMQSIFRPFFQIIYAFFFDITITGKEHLAHKKGPMLFISNHIGFYDSFMFDFFVKPFSHILPFRFMGTRVFIVPMLAVLKLIGVIDVVYFLFGVFKVTPGEGAEKSLKKAYEIIKHGGTVAMYPEGRIWHPTNVHPEAIGPFKWGAAILAKNTGVQMIPVSMKRTIVPGAMRPKIEIHIGESFYADKNKKAEEIAEDMREVVVGLYNK